MSKIQRESCSAEKRACRRARSVSARVAPQHRECSRPSMVLDVSMVVPSNRRATLLDAHGKVWLCRRVPYRLSSTAHPLDDDVCDVVLVVGVVPQVEENARAARGAWSNRWSISERRVAYHRGGALASRFHQTSGGRSWRTTDHQPRLLQTCLVPLGKSAWHQDHL
jgi:hypothetical protein